MGFDIFTDNINKLEIKNRIVVNTINAHSYVIAKKDSGFKKALLASDILLPDGSGIVLAAKIINKKKIKKIAGADLHQYLLAELNRCGGKCFYMGASMDTLEKVKNEICKEFPNVMMGGYSPPFKSDFSEKENNEIIQQINSFNPDVLFIGMTAPKQEIWMCKHRDSLEFKVAASIGAVFDFYAGNVNRAPKWMIDAGLEWLHRSFKSKKLMMRNLKSNPVFLYDVIREKLK